MNENEGKQDNLLGTTDCLEAVGVFRAWKNGLFVISMVCLVLLQLLFWAVNLDVVSIGAVQPAQAAALVEPKTPEPNAPTSKAPGVAGAEITGAAKIVAGDANLDSGTTPPRRPRRPMATGPLLAKEPGHLDSLARFLIRFLDFVLILAAILFCLTTLFSLKISLLGRLGGINHISRAFFLSLLFVVLILPWQKFFGATVKGAIYTPAELAGWVNWYEDPASGVLGMVLYYLRFTGYWLLVMLVGILSQIRSGRWARATLRRLEII